MYILEIRIKESQRVIYRRISRWQWLHTWRVKRITLTGLCYMKCYVLNEV